VFERNREQPVYPVVVIPFDVVVASFCSSSLAMIAGWTEVLTEALTDAVAIAVCDAVYDARAVALFVACPVALTVASMVAC
jgi:hypothetical protein